MPDVTPAWWARLWGKADRKAATPARKKKTGAKYAAASKRSNKALKAAAKK